MRTGARLAVVAVLTVVAGPVGAQTRCTETTRFDPPLRVLRCADGLVLETETAGTLRPVDRDGDGHLEGAEIGGHAVFVTIPASRRVRREGFQILTPHAIASVRGTVYAVGVPEGDVVTTRWEQGLDAAGFPFKSLCHDRWV